MRRYKSDQAKKVSKPIRRYVRRKIDDNLEMKRKTYAFNNLVDTTGDVGHITAIQQGVLDSDRVGDSFKLKHLRIRWRVERSDVILHTRVRLVVFQSKVYQTGTPAISSVLGGGFTMESFPEWDRRVNFAILYDKTVYVNEGKAKELGTTKRYDSISLRRAVSKVQYSAGSDTNVTNGLYFMVFSDQTSTSGPSASDARPRVTVNIETQFTDA